MIRKFRRLLLLGAVAGGALTGAGGASAAVQIGPDLAATPIDNGVGCVALPGFCTRIALQVAGGPLQQAPFDGVLTRWRFRAFCCSPPHGVPSRIILRTFGPGPNNGNPSPTYVGTQGAVFEVPVGGALDVASVIDAPVRIPIAAGRWIGVDTDWPIGMAVYYGVPGGQSPGQYEYKDPAVGDGVEFAGLNTVPNRALAMNVTLEADADKDGFGDETQDCQPSDPASHIPCPGGTPPPPPPPPPTPPLPVGGGGPCSQPPPWCSGGGVVYPTIAVGGIPPSDGRVVFITVRCSPYTTSLCGGRLLLTVPGKSSKAYGTHAVKPRLIGIVRYRLGVGGKAKIKVKLNATGRQLLAKQRRLTVTLTIKPDKGQLRKSRYVVKLKRK